MASTPLVANEVPTGTSGIDGLAVFTFTADIDQANHRIAVDRLEQGNTIDYAVTGARQVTFAAGSIPVKGALIWLFNGVAGVTTGTGSPGWRSVAELVSDAAIELGLVRSAIVDPFASTDTNILQLLAVLKSGGRSMAKHRNWHHLEKEFTFPTIVGANVYALPTDYRSFVDDSGWNRTTQIRLHGPLSAQEWQLLQARNTVSPTCTAFRIWQAQMFLAPTPGSVQTIAFEYQGSSWIRPAAAAQPSSDTPAAKDDVVCFDSAFVVARLKMDFRRNKKQPSDSEQGDYEDALSAAENEDAQGKTIYLGGRRAGPRRLSAWNLPPVIG